MKEKISIILPTYNGARYIEKQLESLVKQSFPAYEIIIVDDVSKDETVEIIKRYTLKYEFIKFFQNEINLNAIASFQKAASLAGGDYIAFCDQDDIWEQNKIENQINLLRSNEVDETKPLLLFHDLSVIDENDIMTAASFWDMMKFRKYNFRFESLLFKNVVTGCTMIINKKMKDVFCATDVREIMMHDHWFALVAFSFGTAIYDRKVLIKYRTHSNSVTSKDKMTFSFKFQNLINNIKRNKSSYFVSNIRQAKEFYRMFEKEIDLDTKESLVRMIALEKSPLIVKIARPFFRFRNLLYR